MTWAVERDLDLCQLPDIEDGQRLGRAVVSVSPGAGPPLCLYSAHPRHLVWHRATNSGLGSGLQQLQNIPTQSETFIRLRQVPSGEDLTIKVTGRTFVLSLCRSCMLYCLTHVFIPLWLFAETIMKVLQIWYSSCLCKLVLGKWAIDNGRTWVKCIKLIVKCNCCYWQRCCSCSQMNLIFSFRTHNTSLPPHQHWLWSGLQDGASVGLPHGGGWAENQGQQGDGLLQDHLPLLHQDQESLWQSWI